MQISITLFLEKGRKRHANNWDSLIFFILSFKLTILILL